MRRGLFRRIFLLYAVVIVLAVVFVEISITSAIRTNYLKTLRSSLTAQIGLVAKTISFNQTNLDNLCRGLKKDTNARVTIIASEGRVIGDSDIDSSLMDNHLHRTEIEQALLFETGMAIRYSDTMNHDFLYVAKKISQGQQEGFIRLAVPLKEIDNAVNLLRMKIILAVLAVFLVMWIFSIWQTDHLRRLLRQITDFSKSLSRGEIDKRIFLHNAGEFSEISDNLTSMSVKLQATLAESEEERNRLNVILRSVPDGLLIIDARGFITLSSASVRDFFGDTAMTGLPFIEVVRNHEFSDVMDEVRSSLSPGTTEFRIDYPSEKYLSVRVSPLFYNERELSGFVAIFHDITQIEKLEQIRKDFVANV
ncbi:MAG: PAS domain S-box protein, partial [Nitrospirota bacterium]|nr:PAS domain S-box protein [Nitrospirota bacterium]